MRHLPPSHLFSILAVLTLAGCVTASPFRHRRPGPEESTVEVRNDRWQDVVVYLAREQSLLRLGVVQGKSVGTLSIPAEYVRLNCWVRFVARTTGGETQAVSELFGMGPGSRVSWFVPLTSGETPVTITNAAG
jgi:hypothetical protein